MNNAREASPARLANLLVPGGGLILIGSETLGVLIALLFTLAAVFAIAATLLFPDNVPRVWRALAIGVTLGTYLGAQIRFAQTVRDRRELSRQRLRHTALHSARIALRQGRADEAWAALEPVSGLAEGDLLVAYRVAQALTARGEMRAARAAWQRVRRLDRHRIYRPEVIENERRIANTQSENH